MSNPWEILKISRASYYRKLHSSPHSCLIEQYNEYQTQSVYERDKSQGYLKRSMYQLQKYLKAYPIVTPEGLASFIAEVPAERFSTRKDRHAAVSSFARFLHTTGRMPQEEYFKIRMLYPKKSKYHKKNNESLMKQT